MKAKDVMRTPVITVPPSMVISELEELFTAEGISASPVQRKSGIIAGVVTKTDVVQALRFLKNDKLKDALGPELSVGDVMNPWAVFVAPDAPAGLVAERMVNDQIHHVLVGSARHIVGIVSSFDLIAAMS